MNFTITTQKNTHTHMSSSISLSRQLSPEVTSHCGSVMKIYDDNRHLDIVMMVVGFVLSMLITLGSNYICSISAAALIVLLWWASSRDDIFKHRSNSSLLFTVTLVSLVLLRNWSIKNPFYLACLLPVYIVNVVCLSKRFGWESSAINFNIRLSVYQENRKNGVLRFIWLSAALMRGISLLVGAASILVVFVGIADLC